MLEPELEDEIGGDECGEVLPGDENLPLAGHTGAVTIREMPDLGFDLPSLGHSTSIDGVGAGYVQNEFGINPTDGEIMSVLGKSYLSQQHLCQGLRDLFSDCWGNQPEWTRVLERWANTNDDVIVRPWPIDFGRASVPMRIQSLVRLAGAPQDDFTQFPRLMTRDDETAAVVDLGALSLRFGRTDRITMHEDGVTPESDTDHTVMLGLVACAFAANHPSMGLDLGKIAQYALVHDLVEAYVGDTPTLQVPTAESEAIKAEREAGGMESLVQAFNDRLPWVVQALRSYEQRRAPEARYVKAMDKLLPKITHALNGGVTVREQGMDRADLIRRWEVQFDELMAYAGDFPQLFSLRQDLLDLTLERFIDPGATAPR